MAGRGGKRPGAGRKKGSLGKKTVEAKAAKDGVTPLEYLLKRMRNTKLPHERREQLAIAAAPYCHPRMAAINHTGDMTLKTMTQEQWVEEQERLNAAEDANAK